MKRFIFYVLAVFFVFSAQASNTQAYTTTAQHAFTVDGKTGVYTISFSFGHAKHDVYIPVQAKTGSARSNEYLSYVMHSAEGETAHGETTAIVLSKAPLQNGMYVAKKGFKETFTLLVFFKPTLPETSSAFKLDVTALPFSFDQKQQLSLNASELQYYTTDLLPLKKKVSLDIISCNPSSCPAKLK